VIKKEFASDPSEFEIAPSLPPPPKKPGPTPAEAEARVKLAICEARVLAEQESVEIPAARWKAVVALLGLPETIRVASSHLVLLKNLT
jgi:hypothetical protein